MVEKVAYYFFPGLGKKEGRSVYSKSMGGEERERERERELNDYQNLCNNPVEKTNQDLEVLNHHS